MSTHTEEIFDALLGCLSDPSDDVVRQSLAVLPEICSTPSTTNTQGNLILIIFILFFEKVCNKIANTIQIFLMYSTVHITESFYLAF